MINLDLVIVNEEYQSRHHGCHLSYTSEKNLNPQQMSQTNKHTVVSYMYKPQKTQNFANSPEVLRKQVISCG